MYQKLWTAKVSACPTPYTGGELYQDTKYEPNVLNKETTLLLHFMFNDFLMRTF